MGSQPGVLKGRTFGLTQKGATAICEMCGGVGAVLALAIEEGQEYGGHVTPTSFAACNPNHCDHSDHDAHVQEAVEVLIPCPACFLGMQPWIVVPNG